MPQNISWRRLLLAAGCVTGLIASAAPSGAAFGRPEALSGRPDVDPRPTPSNSPPGDVRWSPQPGRQEPPTGPAIGPYLGYVALTGAYVVATVDVAAHRIVATHIATDAARAVVATPDGHRLYVANTGQYDVLVVDPVSGTGRPLPVGPYPQDVAISPDGAKVYAAVSGGDTGRGGSDVVAVIDTRTETVVRRIHVGNAPRRIVVARDGRRAYVTHDGGIAVIDTSRDQVIRSIRDPSGPQGVAVDPGGRTLYVTRPRAGDVQVIDAATGRVRHRIRVGAQPWGVAFTRDGAKAYVTRSGHNSLAVIDTATRRVRQRITVGRLPASVAVTPDGAEAWVGNALSGTVSVISTASDTVLTTIVGGPGAKTIGARPLGITFARRPG